MSVAWLGEVLVCWCCLERGNEMCTLYIVLGLNGPSGPLKPRPCGLLWGFAPTLTGFTSPIISFKSFKSIKSINSFNTFYNDDERKKTY